jgi:hypothetical protein
MASHPNWNVFPLCASVAVSLAAALAAGNSLFASLTTPQSKVMHLTVSGDHSLWSVDLRSLGYPASNPKLQLGRGLEKFNSVDFVSESVLAATFLSREIVPDLQRRDDPNRAHPYRLHAVFLDVATGKVLKTLDWPLDNPVAGIFPRFDGSFLFFSTDRVVSYSTDWAKGNEISIPQLQGSPPFGGISQSPSGKTLVVQFRRGTSSICLRIHTDTMDSSESTCEIQELFTASDEGIAAPTGLPGVDSGENSPSGPIVQYDVSMPATSSDPRGKIQNPESKHFARTFCSSCVGMPQFVNNETIVVYSPLHLSLTDRRGDLKFAQDLDPREIWIDELGRPVRSSANGQRFAVAFNTSLFRVGAPIGIHMSTGDMPAAFPDHIDVYDLTAERWIYTLQVKGTHIHQIWGLALSPNGERIVVDSGGVIQAYALPPESHPPKQ